MEVRRRGGRVRPARALTLHEESFWAARLLLVSAAGVLAFGGIFIVVSIGIRMKNGEWLRRAGPFEISEGKLSQAEDEIDFWRQATLSSREEAAGLRERLKRCKELIGDLEGR